MITLQSQYNLWTVAVLMQKALIHTHDVLKDVADLSKMSEKQLEPVKFIDHFLTQPRLFQHTD